MNWLTLFCCICLTVELHASDPWVHRYQLNMHQAVQTGPDTLVFSSATAPYSQLLFAWNAFRPTRGTLSFFVSARMKDTGKWGAWHHAIDWRKDAQQSFLTPSDGYSSYHHVRLEIEPGQQADGFKLKVVAHDGAQLDWLKRFVVTTVDSKRYQQESSALYAQKQSVYICGVPALSQMKLDHQDAGRMCSPTSCAMLAGYLLNVGHNALAMGQPIYDAGLDTYGSWPFNVAHLFERSNGSYAFFHTRLNSFDELYQQLHNGIPVIVSIRGVLANRSYPHGHLVVVTGFDATTQEVVCNDPAHEDEKMVKTRYALKDFLVAWQNSRRLVYWASPIKNNTLSASTKGVG